MVGFIGLVGERVNRKKMLLYGNVGALVLTLITYETIGTWSKYIIMFWMLVIVLNAFVQLGYLAEDTVPEILCIAMQILLAVAGILNNYMIWMVQVIIFHGMPGGTATHGKRGTAQA